MTRFAPVLALALAALAPARAAAQDASPWSYTPAIGETPMQTLLVLAYGGPQAGGARLLATCVIGANWIYADVRLGADIGGMPDGGTVSVRISGNGLSRDYGATVTRVGDGLEGLRLALPLDDPFWEALGGPQPITYAVPGHPEALLPVEGARGASLAFLGDCGAIGDLRPPRAKR